MVQILSSDQVPRSYGSVGQERPVSSQKPHAKILLGLISLALVALGAVALVAVTQEEAVEPQELYGDFYEHRRVGDYEYRVKARDRFIAGADVYSQLPIGNDAAIAEAAKKIALKALAGSLAAGAPAPAAASAGAKPAAKPAAASAAAKPAAASAAKPAAASAAAASKPAASAASAGSAAASSGGSSGGSSVSSGSSKLPAPATPHMGGILIVVPVALGLLIYVVLMSRS